MKLSVSLKIFLGFIVVVVSFGAVSIYDILRTHRVQEDLRRLAKVYLTLNEVYRALDIRVTQLRALHRNIRDLIQTAKGARGNAHINRYMPLAQRYRDKRLTEIRRIAERGLALDVSARDRGFLQQLIQSTHTLATDFHREDRLYLLAIGKRPGDPKHARPGTRTQNERAELLRIMGRTRMRLTQMGAGLRRVLTRNLSTQIGRTVRRLEEAESRTLLLSVVFTVFALLIAVVMMLLAHWTLRPLQTLRRGARIIGRGEYAHRVSIKARDEIGDLAQDFNTMAEAIQEREARLIETERLAARSERLATVGRMASQITHEVRNPLSSIQLNAEMLEEELAATGLGQASEARALLTAIQREVDRLTEVTEAYLQFARLPRPRLEEDDLGELVRSVVAFTEGELRAADIEVRLELDESLPPLAFDENQIRQALINLIRNAREAMVEGGTLTMSVKLAGQGVQVAVADTGVGMDEEQQGKIFDPFFSTKDKGTGLGLAITAQIIEEHGGTIDVESEPGKGTRFLVNLPRGGAPPAPSPGADPA